MSKSKARRARAKQLEKRNNEILRRNTFLNFASVEKMQKKPIDGLTKRYILRAESGKIIDSPATFYNAVSNASFPMDPPNGELWDGLADSLFGGFLTPKFKYNYVNVFWLNANDSAAASPTFFINTVKWFSQVAVSVSATKEDEPFHEENGVVLRLFLICSNEESAEELRDELNLPY